MKVQDVAKDIGILGLRCMGPLFRGVAFSSRQRASRISDGGGCWDLTRCRPCNASNFMVPACCFRCAMLTNLFVQTQHASTVAGIRYG